MATTILDVCAIIERTGTDASGQPQKAFFHKVGKAFVNGSPEVKVLLSETPTTGSLMTSRPLPPKGQKRDKTPLVAGVEKFEVPGANGKPRGFGAATKSGGITLTVNSYPFPELVKGGDMGICLTLVPKTTASADPSGDAGDDEVPF